LSRPHDNRRVIDGIKVEVKIVEPDIKACEVLVLYLTKDNINQELLKVGVEPLNAVSKTPELWRSENLLDVFMSILAGAAVFSGLIFTICRGVVCVATCMGNCDLQTRQMGRQPRGAGRWLYAGQGSLCFVLFICNRRGDAERLERGVSEIEQHTP